MAECRYCGEPAGFLRWSHRSCKDAHRSALSEIGEIAHWAARGRGEVERVQDSARELAVRGHVGDEEIRGAYLSAWESTVDHFLGDGALAPEEERSLVAYSRAVGLTTQELDRSGSLTRLAKAGTLRDLMEGKLPRRVQIDGTLAFNLQRSEKLIWVFPGTDYFEDRTRRSYVGRSSGVSIRVMKGVYYRVGAFQGHPVESTERVRVDHGTMAVTTKHVYFAGPSKSLRVRHDKIVSYIPFTDGVGIVRDAATAKPQIFKTGDGWFTYNLLSNVAQFEPASTDEE